MSSVVVSSPPATSPSPSETLVELKDVSFGYTRTRKILSGVTLTVPKGKLVAVMGGSGCGKTTILRLLCGQHQIGCFAAQTVGDAHGIAQVTHHLSVPSAELLADKDGFHVIDVRRAGAYQSAQDCLPGATWRDPEKVAQWSDALHSGNPVLVYCVYGHEVGQSTAAILRARGIDARFLVGGIHDWKASGLPLQAKGAGHA